MCFFFHPALSHCASEEVSNHHSISYSPCSVFRFRKRKAHRWPRRTRSASARCRWRTTRPPSTKRSNGCWWNHGPARSSRASSPSAKCLVSLQFAAHATSRFLLIFAMFFCFPFALSLSRATGTLIGNNGTRQPPVSQGTVVPCHKGELHKSRVMKRRQAFTATASL